MMILILKFNIFQMKLRIKQEFYLNIQNLQTKSKIKKVKSNEQKLLHLKSKWLLRKQQLKLIRGFFEDPLNKTWIFPSRILEKTISLRLNLQIQYIRYQYFYIFKHYQFLAFSLIQQLIDYLFIVYYSIIQKQQKKKIMVRLFAIFLLLFTTLGLQAQKSQVNSIQIQIQKQNIQVKEEQLKSQLKSKEVKEQSKIEIQKSNINIIQQHWRPVLLSLKQTLQAHIAMANNSQISVIFDHLNNIGRFIKKYWNLFKKEIKYRLILIWLEQSHRIEYQEYQFVEIVSELILIFFSLVFWLIFLVGFLKFMGIKNTAIRAGSLAALIHVTLVVIAGGSPKAVFQMIGAIGILFFITRKAGRIIFTIIFLILAWIIIFDKDSSVRFQLQL